MSRSNGDGGSRLWAMTSYFNPVGYRRRHENYLRFRSRLNAPLIAIELASHGRFELGEGDADILIQVRGGDVMWQKERLLNIALANLPEECRFVAWLDCDIIFVSEDWAWRASQLLERYAFVQLFRRVHYLQPDVALDRVGPETATWSREAIASAIDCGASPAEALRSHNGREIPRYARGVAWAAGRELIADRCLFDASIIGGGDSAVVSAAYSCFDYVIERQEMWEGQAARYRDWAGPFRDAVAGKVGALDGEVFHFWHGSMDKRGHRERFRGLRPFRFDPATDIAAAANEPWRWSSAKTDMHDYVRSYFVARAEDG